MKLLLTAGSTSNILQVFIRDSSSTTGAGLTGLAFNSASLTAYYHKDADTTATAITLVTMTVGTYTSSGFKEIDATNMPGWYQFCPPNAAVSSGASVSFHLKGATNMAPLPIEVQLIAANLQNATTLGLTNLDATVSSRSTYAGGDTSGTTTLLTRLPSAITLAAGAVTVGTNNDKTGYSLSQSFPTNFSSLAITGGGAVTAGTVSDKTGYSLDLTQAVPTTNTAETVGDALNAARAQGFGKWVLSGTTLTLYANDGSTAVRTFTLDSSTAPTQRV